MAAWRSSEHKQSEPPPDSAQPAAITPGSAEPKVALFRRLFRGRDDVYALRWQSSSSGRSGYAPACANEWQPGDCKKHRIGCRECHHRKLLPLTDAAIYDHLAGEHTPGLYPLLENDACHLVAVDFDEQDWREEAREHGPIMAPFKVKPSQSSTRSARICSFRANCKTALPFNARYQEFPWSSFNFPG